MLTQDEDICEFLVRLCKVLDTIILGFIGSSPALGVTLGTKVS